jgi:hypothetical protein
MMLTCGVFGKYLGKVISMEPLDSHGGFIRKGRKARIHTHTHTHSNPSVKNRWINIIYTYNVIIIVP